MLSQMSKPACTNLTFCVIVDVNMFKRGTAGRDSLKIVHAVMHGGVCQGVGKSLLTAISDRLVVPVPSLHDQSVR